jgi:hypothetical protein
VEFNSTIVTPFLKKGPNWGQEKSRYQWPSWQGDGIRVSVLNLPNSRGRCFDSCARGSPLCSMEGIPDNRKAIVKGWAQEVRFVNTDPCQRACLLFLFFLMTVSKFSKREGPVEPTVEQRFGENYRFSGECMTQLTTLLTLFEHARHSIRTLLCQNTRILNSCIIARTYIVHNPCDQKKTAPCPRTTRMTKGRQVLQSA